MITIEDGESARAASVTLIRGGDRRELAAIFAGGVVGGLLRVALLQTHAGAAPGWPWVTFAENVTGTFLLGYFATRLQERLPLSAYRRPLLGTGFCGAFYDLLDDAARARDDVGREPVRTGDRLRLLEHHCRLQQRSPRHRVRAPDEEGAMSVPVWIGVGLLGGCGALLRFVVDGLVATRSRGDFPLGTFLVKA